MRRSRFAAGRNDSPPKSPASLRHVHRRRRPAQLLRPAAGVGGAALRRPRHPRALGRYPRGCACSGSATRRPISGLFREEAERCLAFMPAAQGVVKWPSDRPTLAALVDELELPLPDAAVDRVLLVHALEMAHDPEALLREVWRVLAAGGRLLAVVPNRRGVWARMDTTPFGHGRPYSRSQITHLLRETWFTPTGWGEALLCAADRARLVPALGGGLGADRRDACPRRSPACTSSRRRSRSIARSRRGATRAAGARARAGARAITPGRRRGVRVAIVALASADGSSSSPAGVPPPCMSGRGPRWRRRRRCSGKRSAGRHGHSGVAVWLGCCCCGAPPVMKDGSRSTSPLLRPRAARRLG